MHQAGQAELIAARTAGAEVMGRVVAVRDVDGNYGTKPALTIETVEGPITVWASHSVLRGELEKTPPAPGSRILIRYDGTQTASAGHKYHAHSLAVAQTLDVTPGQNWVDVFNGTATSPEGTARTTPQPAGEPPSNPKPFDASGLPF